MPVTAYNKNQRSGITIILKGNRIKSLSYLKMDQKDFISMVDIYDPGSVSKWIDDTVKTIRYNIRYYRMQRGMTSDQLAELSGLCESSIGCLESRAEGLKDRKLSRRTEYQIAAALRICPHLLETPLSESGVTAVPLLKPEEGKKLSNAIRRLLADKRYTADEIAGMFGIRKEELKRYQ